MTERVFRLTTTVHGPPLRRMAPPTLELYEELCRAEVERAIRRAEAERSRLVVSGVELIGDYPETLIRVSGALGERAVRYDVDLYRPGWYRMRFGRLRAPSYWHDKITMQLHEPLGWLLADEGDDAHCSLLAQEVYEMAGAFGGGLRRLRPQRIGEGRMRRIAVMLEEPGGRRVMPETPMWRDGERRPLWEIADALRAEARAAIGAKPMPEKPLLSWHVAHNAKPED